MQLLIRHNDLFPDFDQPMPWRIHRLKNYKIISSERAGLNNELNILVSPLSSLLIFLQVAILTATSSVKRFVDLQEISSIISCNIGKGHLSPRRDKRAVGAPKSLVAPS